MSDEIKENQNEEKLRTAVVAIIGRPSAGKSTFLNTVNEIWKIRRFSNYKFIYRISVIPVLKY